MPVSEEVAFHNGTIFDGRTFHQPEMMVAVLFLALLGVLINFAADLGTRRFLPWYRRSE